MINLKRHLKTPNLFDVPRDRPTKKQTWRAQLEWFKNNSGIFTHGHNDTGWHAMIVPRSREILAGYPNTAHVPAIELIMDYCRLLEEADLLTVGNTERQAIEELCRLNKIQFDL